MKMKKGDKPPQAAAITILDVEDISLDWNVQKGYRESLYLKSLLELEKDPKKMMQVENKTARGAIQQQAKKHAIKVIFAERGTLLFCRVLGKFSPEELVLSKLKNDGPTSFMGLCEHLAKFGFKDENPKNLLSSLSNTSLVFLEDDKTMGKVWKLSPKGLEYCLDKKYE